MTKREYKLWLTLIVVIVLYFATGCSSRYEIGQNEQRLFKECMELAADLTTSDDHTDDIINECRKTARSQAQFMGIEPKNIEEAAWD